MEKVTLIKMVLLHTAVLVGVTILAGIATGFLTALTAGEPATVAGWCARAYLGLAMLLPLGLWIAVVTFFDRARELYREWGGVLIVTVLPAILGALAARLTFVGPATTAVAMVRPQIDTAALVTVMAAQFGWAVMLPVLIATVVGALLIAVWSRRRGSASPGIDGGC